MVKHKQRPAALDRRRRNVLPRCREELCVREVLRLCTAKHSSASASEQHVGGHAASRQFAVFLAVSKHQHRWLGQRCSGRRSRLQKGSARHEHGCARVFQPAQHEMRTISGGL